MADRRDRIDSPFPSRENPPPLGELTGDLLPPDTKRVLADKDGNIWVGNFKMTPRGLQTEKPASLREWQAVGQVLQRTNSAFQWLIGDWLNYGEREWEDTYEGIAEKLGYSVKSLYQYKWVANKIEFSRRLVNLSFGHHEAVAALSSDDQDAWLAHALKEGWSVATLRRELQQKSRPTTVSRFVSLLERNREKYDIFRRKLRKLEPGEKLQVAQLIEQEIESLQELKRSLER